MRNWTYLPGTSRTSWWVPSTSNICGPSARTGSGFPLDSRRRVAEKIDVAPHPSAPSVDGPAAAWATSVYCHPLRATWTNPWQKEIHLQSQASWLNADSQLKFSNRNKWCHWIRMPGDQKPTGRRNLHMHTSSLFDISNYCVRGDAYRYPAHSNLLTSRGHRRHMSAGGLRSDRRMRAIVASDHGGERNLEQLDLHSPSFLGSLDSADFKIQVSPPRGHQFVTE